LITHSARRGPKAPRVVTDRHKTNPRWRRPSPCHPCTKLCLRHASIRPSSRSRARCFAESPVPAASASPGRPSLAAHGAANFRTLANSLLLVLSSKVESATEHIIARTWACHRLSPDPLGSSKVVLQTSVSAVAGLPQTHPSWLPQNQSSSSSAQTVPPPAARTSGKSHGPPYGSITSCREGRESVMVQRPPDLQAQSPIDGTAEAARKHVGSGSRPSRAAATSANSKNVSSIQHRSKHTAAFTRRVEVTQNEHRTRAPPSKLVENCG
jgi:hypothetical protein